MFRRLGVLVVSLAFVIVVVPTTAEAHDAKYPHVHGHVETNPRDNNGIPRTGDVVPPTGGNYVPPTPPVGWYFKADPIRWSPPTQRDGFTDCARLSDGRYASGYVHYQTLPISGHDYAHEDLFASNYSCQYPDLPAVSDVECSVSTNMKVIGSAGPAASSFPAVNMTVSSPWALSDRKNPALCDTSMKADMNTSLNVMGQYIRTGTSTMVPCKRFDYGGGQAAEIGDCGAPFTSTWEKQAQVWCNGWDETHDGGHTYTMAECATVVDKEWWCNDSVPTLDTRPGSHAVLDDGRRHDAKWNPISVSGSSRMHVNTVIPKMTQVTVTGTPSRPAAAQSASNQKYSAPSAVEVPGEPVGLRIFPLRWYAPGMPSTPAHDNTWKLKRTVDFTASFEVEIVTIDYVDPRDGEAHMVPLIRYETRPGECVSTLAVTVNRARNYR